MPRALPLAVREQVVQRRQQGQALVEIAGQLGLSYRTVRQTWQRFRKQGAAGLAIHYERCGPRGIRFCAAIHQRALALKREHPRWGATLIRLQLAEEFADQSLPSPRTLQRWFRAAGLQGPRPHPPPVVRQRAKRVHEVWEVDAKERMRLGDGSASSVLTVTDEASGALLGVVAFPPLLLEASDAPRCSRGAASPLRAVGSARADPRRSRRALGRPRRPADGPGSLVDWPGHRSGLEPAAPPPRERLRRALQWAGGQLGGARALPEPQRVGAAAGLGGKGATGTLSLHWGKESEGGLSRIGTEPARLPGGH
jgi:hypothetical protein